MHKSHRFDIKNPKIFWRGGKAPSADPTPNGEGDTPSPHPTPLGAFGASILAPSALDLSAFGASSLNPPIENFWLRHWRLAL